MAVKTAQVSVSTTAVRLNTATTTGKKSGTLVHLKNAGAVSVWLGTSAVNNTTGYELAAAGEFSTSLEGGELLYGRTGSGTAVVHVLQSGT